MVPSWWAPAPAQGHILRGPDGCGSSSLLPWAAWPVHPDTLPSWGTFGAPVGPLGCVCSGIRRIVRTVALSVGSSKVVLPSELRRTTTTHIGSLGLGKHSPHTLDPDPPWVRVPQSSQSARGSTRDLLEVLCPVTPLLRCDPRMGATTVSSMDGHIWRWAGNIPPGFEPEFEPRLAHYSKCYTYTWFLLGFAKHIHIQFGA